MIANQFWKTGFIRGLIPVTVTIAATAIIVRYGLMELTNFNLSSISYLYEDMAASILATPKAYIILITTAFLASRMNLRYGWDFNGILIPSLLALQWYQPLKILATVVEASVILVFSDLLLKTPWLKRMTIEGARKLLLFFNVSFVYKLVLGYVLLYGFPHLKVTDYYGFGYLLSTLMAVKIHDKAILARLTRATMQTSLVSVLIATIVGYGLTLLPISNLFLASAQQETVELDDEQLQPDQNLEDWLKLDKIRIYQSRLNNRFREPDFQELELFSQAIKLILEYRNNADPLILERASGYLDSVNYQLHLVQNRYVYLHEKPPLIGWGLYVIDLQSPSPLAISIPAALDEKGVFDAGVTLFQMLEAGSLAISGSSRKLRPELNPDVLLNNQSFFHRFHQLVNRNDSLQIHTYNKRLARQLSGSRRSNEAFNIKGLQSILWVKQSIPASLDLVRFKQLISDFSIDWSQPAFVNQQRVSSRFGFAELILTRKEMRQLMVKPLLLKNQIDYVEQDVRLEGYLQEWILNSKELIASKGSERYQVASQEELLFTDEQIITPLLQLASGFSQQHGWSEEEQGSLQVIAHAASAIGYQVIHYKEKQTSQEYLILTERPGDSMRYWGLYVFRLGQSQQYMIQIPRPLFEFNSFEFGVAMFERVKARLLMISTTHPYANQDGSSDLISSANLNSLFNVVNQVMLREHPVADILAVSCRAFSYRPDQPAVEADVLFAHSQGVIDDSQIDGLLKQLLTMLENDHLVIQPVDGSELTTGYEIGGSSQARYLRATQNKQYAMLWLSPLARAGYRQQDDNAWQSAQFRSLQIESTQQSLIEYLLAHQLSDAAQARDALQPVIFDYIQSQDVIRLQGVVSLARQLQLRLKHIVDISTKQAFLIVHNQKDEILAVVNLLPQGKTVVTLDQSSDLKPQILSFLEHRKAWLQAE